MNDDNLRTDIKVLKAIGQIDNYAEVAEMIDIKVNSFYNWLNGYYNLSYAKKQKLKEIADILSID